MEMQRLKVVDHSPSDVCRLRVAYDVARIIMLLMFLHQCRM